MYRIAIVGAGGMAGTHARAYAEIPNARLVGVMDIREEAAAALAGAHGAEAFTDFASMLDTVKPDIVDVCVPTPFHAEYVCKAAEAKLYGIVVEKPMGRTVAECETMIAACEAAGVPLFVAQVLRFFPEFAAAKAQVQSGAVGEVAAIRTRRGGPFPRAWENWYGNVAMSGGAILDLIIHDFDWLRWTFGEVERVYARSITGSLPEDAVVDKDYALVTLRFESGAIAHVEGTWADPGGFKVNFEIAGTEGLLEYNFNLPSTPAFVATLAEADGMRAGVPVPESPLASSPYKDELAHFLDSLERGVPASVTGQEGREAVRIALAAIESTRTGQPVTLSR